MLNMFWALLNSDHCLSHVAFRYVVKKLRYYKKLHYAAFALFPNISVAISLLHYVLCYLITFSVVVSAVKIHQMEKWTCQLTSSFITVTLCPQYATGKTSVATYT